MDDKQQYAQQQPQGYGVPPQGYAQPQGYGVPPQGYGVQPQYAVPQGYAPQGYGVQQPYDPSKQEQQQPQQQPPVQQGAVVTAGAPKYQDVWAVVLYAAHLVAFIAVTALSIAAFRQQVQQQQPTNSTPSPLGVEPDSAIIGRVVGVTAAVSLICSGLYMTAMLRMPGTLIHMSFLVSIGLLAAMALFFFVQRSPAGGIFYVIFALVNAWLYYVSRSRIPFATVLLKTVVQVLHKMPSSLFVSLTALVVQLAFTVMWIVALVGAQIRFNNSGGGSVVYIFLLFSGYWTTEVIKNVAHVTLSGAYATVYFVGSGQVASPMAASAKRALTYSFGSICLGSLIVALLQLLQTLLRSAADRGGIAAACAACIIDFIQGLVEFFNKYAYTQVAIYGKPFCQAGKDTWKLLKSRGLDLVLNDMLIGKVIGMGILLAGLISGFTAFALANSATVANVPINIFYVIMFTLGGFVVGVMFMVVIMVVVDSGVATLFVCLAQDPQALQRSNPELFEAFRTSYPAVSFGPAV